MTMGHPILRLACKACGGGDKSCAQRCHLSTRSPHGLSDSLVKKQSGREHERDRKMGSPRQNYGRVKERCEYLGLAGGGRWGPFL